GTEGVRVRLGDGEVARVDARIQQVRQAVALQHAFVEVGGPVRVGEQTRADAALTQRLQQWSGLRVVLDVRQPRAEVVVRRLVDDRVRDVRAQGDGGTVHQVAEGEGLVV